MSLGKNISHIPFKEIGNGMLSSGVFLASYALGGYSLGLSVILGSACYAGYRLLFGTDLTHEDLWKDIKGSAARRAVEQITKARLFMTDIKRINNDIPCETLTAQLNELEKHGNNIIELFEKDPRNIKKSKRFIDIYLEGAVSVSNKFAYLYQKLESDTLPKQYEEFLKEMVSAFEKQYRAILDDDVIDLDVEIDVLKQRLKTEAYYD